MVIDAVGIRICAVRANRESLYACLRNMLDGLADVTPVVEIYLLSKTFEYKSPTTEQTEGQCQGGCFHQFSVWSTTSERLGTLTFHPVQMEGQHPPLSNILVNDMVS